MFTVASQTDSMMPLIQDGEFKGSYEPTKGCRHQDSAPTGETCSSGCCDEYKCKTCGKTFMVECPD